MAFSRNNLDTSDMDRHTVELRLFIEKAKRRFSKAQMIDVYERVVKNVLYPPKENTDENQRSHQTSIEIEHMTELEANRLKNFLDDVIAKCFRKDQHEALQKALRESLLQSRRESTKDKFGELNEPFCYFCASGCTHVSKEKETLTSATAANVEQAAMNRISLFPISPPFSIAAPPTPSPPKETSQPPPSSPAKTPPIDLTEPQASKENGKPASTKPSSTMSDEEDDDDDDEQADMELGDDAHEDSMHQWFVDQNKSVDKDQPRASTPLASGNLLPERDPEKPLSLVLRRGSSINNSKHFVKSTVRSPAITIDQNNRQNGLTSFAILQAENRSPGDTILDASKKQQPEPGPVRGRPKTRAQPANNLNLSRPYMSQSVTEAASISNASQGRPRAATQSQNQNGPRKKTTPLRPGSNKRARK